MFQQSKHHNKPGLGSRRWWENQMPTGMHIHGIHDDHHLKCMNVFLDVASWWPWSVDMVTGCFSNGWLQVLIIFLPRGMRWQTYTNIILFDWYDFTNQSLSMYLGMNPNGVTRCVFRTEALSYLRGNDYLYHVAAWPSIHSPGKVFGRRSQTVFPFFGDG